MPNDPAPNDRYWLQLISEHVGVALWRLIGSTRKTTGLQVQSFAESLRCFPGAEVNLSHENGLKRPFLSRNHAECDILLT
jgi:hypothetical protein